LCSSPDIIRVIKWRSMWWPEAVASIGKMRNAYKFW
jgi:hypothetical protein